MTKLGRNDPCSCGSGKKYKKCCLVSIEAVDSEYRRLRQVEEALIPRLLEHAFETFGKESILDAWDEFNDDGSAEEYDPELDDEYDLEFADELDEGPDPETDEDDDPEPAVEYDFEEDEYYLEPTSESDEGPDPESPMNMVFMPWFLFNWTVFQITDDGGSMPSDITIAESFMRTHRRRLSLDEEVLLSGLNRCPFTFCEVVEVKPGKGMKQFDLLRRLEYEVIEHAASQSLRRGDIIYCATSRIGEVSSNIATGPYALRPTAKRDVLDLRAWILEDSDYDEITDEHLEDYEADIRALYLDFVKATLNPTPYITNSDNDPMLPQKLYFDIESAEQAFHALKDLAEGIPESQLLSDAQLEEGRVVSAEIPWLGGRAEVTKRLGGPVLLGNIKIDDRQIMVEVNSSERAELIRELIEKRLGAAVTYKTTLTEPPDRLGAQLAAAAAAGEDSTNNFLSLIDASPELLAELEEMNRAHWEAWFDLPIPALNDMSPREASRTEEGRDLLDSLLLEYERDQDDSPENIIKPDIPALRRELGLE
jgi:hypothetical protein